MLNPETYNYSESAISGQIDYVYATYPYLTSHKPIDKAKAFKADYLDNIDAVFFDQDMESFNIQFKHRRSGNDFVVIAKKLTGKAAHEARIGFYYKGEKYTFDLRRTNIFVETMEGEHYSMTRNELNALECSFPDQLAKLITSIAPRYFYNDNHEKFFAGDYYVYISLDKLERWRCTLFNLRHQPVLISMDLS